MIITLWVLSVAFTIATLIPISRHEAWWVRGFDFPRTQLALIMLILFVSNFMILDLLQIHSWIFVTITELCFVYHL